MQQTMRRSAFPLLLGDIGAFIIALFVALVLRHGEWPSQALFLDHLIPFSALVVLWIGVFFIGGLYDTHVGLIRRDTPMLILKAQLINMLLSALFFFLLPIGITPKTTLALYLISSTALIVGWRLFVFPNVSVGMGMRAVIVGSGDEAKELERILNSNPQLGCVCVETIDTRLYPNAHSVGEKLTTLVNTGQIDSIIADMSDDYAKRLAPLYYDLTFLRANGQFIPLHELYEQLLHRVPLSLIGKTWFLENVNVDASHNGYTLIKRAIDVFGATILLIPCSILFPCIALAIRLEGGGAALYKSDRIGQYNRVMRIYKFRTMTGMDSGTTLNTTHVVTPLGRFLRKTRLDELPQLWNILWGDISFAGPRPETPARARVYAECIPYYNMRHLIKPGLTGWAQINNYDVPRGDVDIHRTIDKLSYDLFYLRRHSLFLDFEIILKTIKTLLLRSGS